MASSPHGSRGHLAARRRQTFEASSSRRLFRGLLGTAASEANHLAAYHGLGRVFPSVARTTCGHHPIAGSGSDALLSHLLKAPLEVLVAPLRDVSHAVEKDTRRHSISMVEEDGADQRLEAVGEQRRKLASSGLRRASSHEQGVTEMQPLRKTRQRDRVDESSPQLRQLSFVIAGEALEEVLPHHEFQNRIAEILEPFVVMTRSADAGTFIGPRGVSHGLAEKLRSTELHTDPLLKSEQGVALALIEVGKEGWLERRRLSSGRGRQLLRRPRRPQLAAPTFSWM